MTSKTISISLNCALITVLSACRPLYRASIPNQPMLTEKNELEVDVGVETGSGYVNASYSLSNHILITAGGNAWSNNNTSAQFGEIGVGFFHYNASENFGGSVLAQTGFGNANVIDNDLFDDPFNGNQTGLIEYNAQFTRFSLQPGIYWKMEHLDVGMGLRNSVVYWLAPSNYDSQTVDGYDIFAEPVVSMQAGSAATKFFLESSLQIPIYRAFRHPVTPFHLGLGISFLISKKTLSSYPQQKAVEQ